MTTGPGPLSILLIGVLVFASVASLAFTLSQAAMRRHQTRRRHGKLVAEARGALAADPALDTTSWFDPAWLGLDLAKLRSLRMSLIRAGYFGEDAVSNYLATSVLLAVVLPVLGILVVPVLFGTWGVAERVAFLFVLLAFAYYLPKAYLARRQRQLEAEYELTFPNFVDMLVVCVNAGLGLEAAVVRAGRELGPTDWAFRANLDLMMAETRAGKSLPDALAAFAGRLRIPEATSFAALLNQTIELGTDLSMALTTFADEIRSKRMFKAEERAAALPPKLTLPLGLFIFPVVLITILAPAVLKVMSSVAR